MTDTPAPCVHATTGRLVVVSIVDTQGCHDTLCRRIILSERRLRTRIVPLGESCAMPGMTQATSCGAHIIERPEEF